MLSDGQERTGPQYPVDFTHRHALIIDFTKHRNHEDEVETCCWEWKGLRQADAERRPNPGDVCQSVVGAQEHTTFRIQENHPTASQPADDRFGYDA
jgi:hypothetical protein